MSQAEGVNQGLKWLAAAIFGAAILVVAVVLFLNAQNNNEEECERWLEQTRLAGQARYEAMLADDGEACSDVFNTCFTEQDVIDNEREIGAATTRPEGCS